MSLAEVMPFGDEQSRSVDRTPPQDVAAEQCVLGAMMISKDAIADVVETLRGTDFYRPAHEQVYDAILDLYGRGEPADGWRRVRAAVRSYADLEPELLGRVEELIDFVTSG